MSRRLAALLPLALAACAPHYEWVETPASSPEPAPKSDTSPDLQGPRTAQDLACEGSTSATRVQGRNDRFRGVEGFNSRGCVRPGPWKTAD